MIRKANIGVAVGFLIVASKLVAFGQASFPYDVETIPRKGVVSNAAFNGSGLDNINVVNGGMTLQVPLASLPAGHAGMGFDLGLVYNSHIYDAVAAQTYNGNISPPGDVPIRRLTPAEGWHYNFENFQIRLETRDLPTSYNCDGSRPGSSGPDGTIADELKRMFRLYVILPDGSPHVLHLGSSPDGFYYNGPDGSIAPCSTSGTAYNQRLKYYTTDGTFLKLEITTDSSASEYGHWPSGEFILYFPDGRQARGHYGLVEKIYDANGNWVQFQYACDATCTNFYVAIRDEFYSVDTSRQIRIDWVTDNTDGVTNQTITAPKPSGTITWDVDWENINSQFTYETSNDYNLTETFNFTHHVVRQISVPSTPTTTYSFDYHDNNDSPAGYGELSSMTVPSGATYSYEFDDSSKVTNYERALENPITTKTVSHDGVTDQWVL